MQLYLSHYFGNFFFGFENRDSAAGANWNFPFDNVSWPTLGPV
jgi:hypothetical protein